MSAGIQLNLGFPTERSVPGPRVWLITASSADAAVFGGTRHDDPARQRRPFTVVNLEDGTSPIAPEDVILLKLSARPDIDVLADPAILRETTSVEVLGRLASLLETAPVTTCERRTLDLGLVRFIGHSKRNRRRGWSRSWFERSLDALLCKGIAADPKLAGRICLDILGNSRLNDASLFRAIAWRMHGDALATSPATEDQRRDVARAYREAGRAFHRAGAVTQATASRRLASSVLVRGLQMDFWGEAAVPRFERDAFGFHLRRLSGMHLPVHLGTWPRTGRSRGLLRHVKVGSMLVDVARIANWLSGAVASSHMASLVDAGPVEHPSSGRVGQHVRYVDLVVDSELATRAGLAGRASGEPGHVREPFFRLVPTSRSCRLEPPSAVSSFGRPARFEIIADRPRRHQVDLLVLTPGTSPSNIRLCI